MKKTVELVCADFKVWDVLDSFQTALKSFGIQMTNSPAGENFDGVILYLSNYKLGKKELKQLDADADLCDPYETEDSE